MSSVAPVAYQHIHRLAVRAGLGNETDAVLLGRFTSQRDGDAFAVLVERHGPMVLNLCRRLVHDAHAAEDAFQATFLALSRHATAIRRPASLTAWLYGTARRFALRLRNVATAASDSQNVTDRRRDPLEEISARELLRILEEELARLPASYQQPLVLCAIDGLTVDEAAQRLNVPATTLRGRLERGRARLHKRLSGRGLSLPAALAAALALPRTAPAMALVESSAQFALGTATVPSNLAALSICSASVGMRWKFALVALSIIGVAGIGAAVLPGGEQKATLAPAKSEAIKEAIADKKDETLAPLAQQRFGTTRMRDCAGPVAFSPDNRFIACATGQYRSAVTLWDRRTGQHVHTLTSSATVQVISFSPDSKYIACATNAWGDIPVFNTASGKRLFVAEGSSPVFKPDGKYLLTLQEGAVRIWDIQTGKRHHEIPIDDSFKASAVSPDGTAVAQAVFDGVITWADFHDDIRLQRLPKPNDASTLKFGGRCQGVSFSNDSLFLAASSQQAVAIWDVKQRKELVRFRQRADSPPVFSADGKRVTWSGYDNQRGGAHVWVADVKADAKPRSIGMWTNNFDTPALSPDGTTVAFIDDGGALVVREVETGEDVTPGGSTGHTGKVLGLNITPDGKHLVSRDKNEVIVWERATGKIVHQLPRELPKGEVIASRGSPVISGPAPVSHIVTFNTSEKKLFLRDLLTLRECLQIEYPDGEGATPFVPVSVAANGSAAAVVDRDHRIRVYDLATGKLRCLHAPGVVTAEVRMTADAKSVVAFCPGRKEGEFLVVDAHTGNLSDKQNLQTPVDMFVERPDGRLSTSGTDAMSWLRRMKLREPDGSELKITWNFAGCNVYLSPDGERVAVRYQEPNPNRQEINDPRDYLRLRMWIARTGMELTHLDQLHGLQENALFSPDGRTFVTTTLKGTAHLWEIASGQERLQLTGHLPGEITSLAFTPDGRALMTGGADSQILLHDLAGKALEKPMSAEHQRERWDILAGGDAAKAYRTIMELAAEGDHVVTFIADRVRSVVKVENERLERLIAALDDIAFAAREKAMAELSSLHEAALPMLRAAFSKPVSPEQEQRLRKLLEPFGRTDVTGERLRLIRAAEILERIGTPAAKKLLQSWASGIEDALLTREARGALARMR